MVSMCVCVYVCMCVCVYVCMGVCVCVFGHFTSVYFGSAAGSLNKMGSFLVSQSFKIV